MRELPSPTIEIVCETLLSPDCTGKMVVSKSRQGYRQEPTDTCTCRGKSTCTCTVRHGMFPLADSPNLSDARKEANARPPRAP